MNIVDLIGQWITDSKNLNLRSISTKYGLSSTHYLTEIIRYWNQIQFITKKTLRSLPQDNILEKLKLETYFYVTYRFFWEEAPFPGIMAEIADDIGSPEKQMLLEFYNRLSTFKWDVALQNKTILEKMSIKCAIPSFTINTLLPVLDFDNIRENITAMDEKARKGIFYIRINNLIVPTKPIAELQVEIVENFNKIGVKLKSDTTFPNLLYANVMDKSKIIRSEYYKQKMIIAQDKASISSVHLLDPQPNELIGDLTAAPGIKTSLIAQQSTNEAVVVAGDLDQKRTHEMKTFLSSFGVTNVHPIQWDGIQPPLLKEAFDKILLDAPCTGSGTFTANPVLKWRQNRRFLSRNVFLQEKLLKTAFDLLKVGGTLVYSTCSLYPEEGEYQIQKIRDDQAKFEDTPSWLPPSYYFNDSPIRGAGRYLPAKHNTIGFFVAKMIK